MVSIVSLWLPILLSAVFVFVASSIIHMLLGYHGNDYRKLPDEEGVADALRKFEIPAGQYSLPHAGSMKAYNSPAFQEKLKKGPQAMITFSPGGAPSMSSNLVAWFVFSIVVGIIAAYVATRALTPGAHYLSVFRFVGVTAFTCYAIGGWSETIWYKRPISVSIKNTIDGLVYACLTAGTFGWLWPEM